MKLDDFFSMTDEDFYVDVYARDGATHILSGQITSKGMKFVKNKEMDGFNIDWRNNRIHIFLKEEEE